MEQYIYDESNGLWYGRDGDYYIPCLKLPEINIGIWGERYLTYIREHKKLLHTKLMINGTLYTWVTRKSAAPSSTSLSIRCICTTTILRSLLIPAKSL